jgi:integrase
MKNRNSVTPVTPKKSTFQSLSKIPGQPGLYRHENGNYYGKKKLRGVKKVSALTDGAGENISDRKLAEKAFKSWVEELENPKPAGAKMPFGDLLAMLKTSWKGKSDGSIEKLDWISYCFEKHMPEFLAIPIDEIKPSKVSEFLAIRSKTLGAQSFNEMSRIIKTAFELAVNDELLESNPYNKVPKTIRKKKFNLQPAKVPTIEQCEAICLNVRNQQFSDTATLTADMLEFMYKAAMGTAECISADWEKVNWEGGFIEVKRVKTGAYFRVPLYAHLKPFLTDLHNRQANPKKGPLFSIQTPKQALYNACARLKLPAYSPIDFRKARITWMLRNGVPAEMIAKWQGHRDNGMLIRKTYSWVISEADNAYEKEQLAKIAPKQPVSVTVD